jgi:hypothetical protein
MARRMIDDSMWANERFAEMPMGARLLQIGIINHADDQGRMKANPIYLRAQVFPYDDVSPKQIHEWLTLMATNGTIILFEVDGRAYLQLTNWWRYQSLQYAQPSQFPRPDGWKDRIRRTLTKGFIVTCNWQKVNGEPLEDTCDQDGKALPGRKPGKDSGGATPEPDAHNTPDDAHVDGDDSGDDSGECLAEGTIELNLTKLNENRKEESAAGASASLPSSSTGDPLMDAAKNKFNRGARSSVSWQAEMNLRLEPAKRVPLVNAVGKACGLTAMMNGRDEILCQVHDTACWFHEHGFTTAEKIEALHKVYLTDEWRRKNHPRPSIEAFMKFASSQLDELPTVPPTNGVVTVDWSNYGGGPLKYMEE